MVSHCVEKSWTTQLFPCFILIYCNDSCYRYVVFTVLDHGTDDDSLLGHVVVDLENLDIEQGYHGTFPLSDMV